MIPGAMINDIAWTDDHTKICVVGGGQQKAATANIDTGAKCGDIIGVNQTLLTVDIKKSRPYKCVLSGEDRELNINKCPPFGHLKSIQNAHTGFVTKLGFTPWDEGAHFVTVSQDKSFKIYNTESMELVFE